MSDASWIAENESFETGNWFPAVLHSPGESPWYAFAEHKERGVSSKTTGSYATYAQAMREARDLACRMNKAGP